MRKKVKILIIVGTHGDERIGIDLVKKLRSGSFKNYFDFIIGNPMACILEKRFFEVDLNRVYPGKIKSNLYEEELAYRNIEIGKRYEYIIDIHEASKSKDGFIIVPKSSLPDKKMLNAVLMEKVILWPSTENIKTGPITQFINGLEIEFGTMGISKQIILEQMEKVVTRFIECIYGINKIKPDDKEIFFVYGKLQSNEMKRKYNLKEFKKIKINNESFFPLLVNQYLKDGVVCYKMRQINKK
jgi:hypothetical protein